MDRRLQEILESGIRQIDPDVAQATVIRRLGKLYDEIELFNPRYALVNASGEELVRRHILDCLAPIGIIREYAAPCAECGKVRFADLGSGSGLPGLVLACVFDSWDINLVERMGRRAGFLRNTVAVLGLSSVVDIVQKDLSEVQNQYDVITFRAFRPFKDIISDLDRILAPNGVILAYKSSEENIQEEIQVLESYTGSRFTARTVGYKVPMLDADRRMLVVKRA